MSRHSSPDRRRERVNDEMIEDRPDLATAQAAVNLYRMHARRGTMESVELYNPALNTTPRHTVAVPGGAQWAEVACTAGVCRLGTTNAVPESLSLNRLAPGAVFRPGLPPALVSMDDVTTLHATLGESARVIVTFW